MAYIAPDGTIKLLANIPLNSNYTDTLYFGSIQEQTSYFNGKAVRTFDNQSYTRAQNNTIRVEVTPDQIYNCNYLMFQNQGFGSAKWFYAFIVKTEYINNACCEITYEIDAMQTWFMQGYLADTSTLLSCLVEREHVEDDALYANLDLENVPIGEYKCGKVEISDLFNDIILVAAVSSEAQIFENDITDPTVLVDNLSQGVKYYRLGTKDMVNSFISKVLKDNLIDSVVSMFYVPKDLLKTTQVPYEDDTTPVAAHNIFSDSQHKLNKPSTPASINYNGKIRNNKLYSYPYCFLGMQAGDQNATFRFEYFTGDPTFVAYMPMQCNIEIGIVPVSYDNPSDNLANDYRNLIIMGGYPLASFSIDSFEAWLAQNKPNLIFNAITSGISGGLAGSMKSNVFNHKTGKLEANKEYNAIDEDVSAGLGLAGTIGSIVNAGNLPPQTSGNFGGYTKMAIGNVVNGQIASRALNIYCKTMRMNDDYIRNVDDYFSRFGYTVNKCMIPNIGNKANSRSKFNYIKTRGTTWRGNAPVDSLDRINNIFNAGITFWKDHDNVGNYSETILDANVAYNKGGVS